MKRCFTVLFLCHVVATVIICSACGTEKPTPPMAIEARPKRHVTQVGIDPTVVFAPTTQDCNGNAVTVDGYNVYIVTGPGPIPTVTTGSTEIPCGVQIIADTTKVTPVNTTLIPVTACTGSPVICSFATTLAKGTYTVAVEAVFQGSQSALSNSLTFAVINRGKAPTSVNVTK